MKKLFIGLMLLFTVSGSTVLGTWWDKNDNGEEERVEEPSQPQEEVADIPFDVPHLLDYVQEDNYCGCESVIKRTNYIMEMKPTTGPWGQSMKTKDPYLNLKIKMNMAGQVWEKPVECMIYHGNMIYASQTIWACRVSASKMVYVVSFKDTNSFLVIYKPKRSLWKAQWAFLESK